jgi:hypothetical protein
MSTQLLLIFVIPVAAVTLFAGADAAWRMKQPPQWTEEDAKQLLDRSPWSLPVQAGIARRLTEDQLREGGLMGQPRGVGNEGVDPKGSGPKVSLNVLTGPGGDDRSQRSLPRGTILHLTWESAMPVRVAELKAHVIEPPVLGGDGYEIAVSGIPGKSFSQDPKQLGDPLKKEAFLKREGKKDVRPLRVEVFQREDSLTAVYLFPLSA